MALSSKKRLYAILRTVDGAATSAVEHEDDDRTASTTRRRALLSSANVELVPFGFESDLFSNTREGKAHVRWLMQKHVLGQDVMLLGAGGPLRRWLALHFCAVTGREVEYVAITRDTTESDLKQRREIVRGGTAVYVDQAVVQAAIHGRVLVLEGLEQAERYAIESRRRHAWDDGMAPSISQRDSHDWWAR